MRYVRRTDEGSLAVYKHPGRRLIETIGSGRPVALLSDERRGDYVRVQRLDEKGRAVGPVGWVDANRLKKRDAAQGQRVSFRGQDLIVGSAGQNMLSGNFSHKGQSECGYAAQDCMPGMPTTGTGYSRDFVTSLPKHGWRELKKGESPSPDDIFVRTGGDGHVGFMAVGPDGQPHEVSWMTINGKPRVDVRPIRSGSRIFTKRR